MKKIIMAANLLTNTQLEYQSAKIFHQERKNDLSIEIHNFRKAIANSQLSNKDSLSKINDTDIYKLAREIKINFTAQEIKSPYS